jgi:hypothetical protein
MSLCGWLVKGLVMTFTTFSSRLDHLVGWSCWRLIYRVKAGCADRRFLSCALLPFPITSEWLWWLGCACRRTFAIQSFSIHFNITNSYKMKWVNYYHYYYYFYNFTVLSNVGSRELLLIPCMRSSFIGESHPPPLPPILPMHARIFVNFHNNTHPISS